MNHKYLENILTTQDLHAKGLSGAQIKTLVAHKKLIRFQRGIYVEAEFVQSLGKFEKPLARVAAVYKSSFNTFVSHQSAALWHGVPLIELQEVVHLSSSRDSSRRRKNTVIHRKRDLAEVAIEMRDGVLVTTPLQTIEDCLDKTSLVEMVNIVNFFLTHQLVTFSQLYELFDSQCGWKKKVAQAVSERLNVQCESPLETVVFNLLCDWGVERPAQQVWVSAGTVSYRADFVWESLKLILEADGFVKYSGEFGDLAAVIRAERARQRELERQGWRFVRVEWTEAVSKPLELRQRLYEAGLR